MYLSFCYWKNTYHKLRMSNNTSLLHWNHPGTSNTLVRLAIHLQTSLYIYLFLHSFLLSRESNIASSFQNYFTSLLSSCLRFQGSCLSYCLSQGEHLSTKPFHYQFSPSVCPPSRHYSSSRPRVMSIHLHFLTMQEAWNKIF